MSRGEKKRRLFYDEHVLTQRFPSLATGRRAGVDAKRLPQVNKKSVKPRIKKSKKAVVG